MIGMQDIITLIVEITLAILALNTHWFKRYFVLPVDKVHVWLVPAQILLVDFARVLAFAYLLKSEKAEKRPRLVMGVVRIITLCIHLGLLGYAFSIFGVKGYALVILANVILFLVDIYFIVVIFSFYNLPPQD